jgi:hypothetical protein
MVPGTENIIEVTFINFEKLRILIPFHIFAKLYIPEMVHSIF